MTAEQIRRTGGAACCRICTGKWFAGSIASGPEQWRCCRCRVSNVRQRRKGMDAGGSEHAGSVFQEDGGAGADLFWRLPVTALRGPERNEAWPADDAYVVSVGGTDLVTASAGGPWKSETAWVDSGGGISPDQIAIPSWQKSAINSTNKGSTVYRNGPDVAANANFTFYTCDDQQACLANEYGGTSFAAPMWAAYTALINQQLASNESGNVGFLDPTIYAETPRRRRTRPIFTTSRVGPREATRR